MSGRVAGATVLALAAILAGAAAVRAMTDEEVKQAVEKAKAYMAAQSEATTDTGGASTAAAVKPPEKTAATTGPAAGKSEENPVSAETKRDIPQVTLSNGPVTMAIYLPDAQRGFYRGMRFNWSGLIAKAEYAGHTFFGPFQPQFNPMVHDNVTGPADEFDMENPPPGTPRPNWASRS